MNWQLVTDKAGHIGYDCFYYCHAPSLLGEQGLHPNWVLVTDEAGHM